nr:MAG TPA: hypothetical protein [Caudoviricetes sp.]
MCYTVRVRCQRVSEPIVASPRYGIGARSVIMASAHGWTHPICCQRQSL